MREKMVPLAIPPGVYRNGTVRDAKGRWYESNLMRWTENGILAPFGGWLQLGSHDLTGYPRGIHAWRTNDGASYLGLGTTGSSTTKAYALSDGTLTDITPASGMTDGDKDGVYASGNYGQGNYGSGNFGEGSGAVTLQDADTWSFDNYGQYLLGVLTSTKKLYWWDKNPANDFVQATGDPGGAIAVVVTPERFIFILGGVPVNGSVRDVRNVRWPKQETDLLTAGDWTPSGTVNAGDFTLTTRGQLITGRAGRRVTLLWTDVDLHTAAYIGGTLIYSFDQAGDNCGIIGPNAVAMVNGSAYWMSHGRFFLYDGAVRPLTCDVADYVFGHLNVAQRAKIYAVPNAQFDEVTWYYTSTEAGSPESLENDRYVTYNYRLGVWYIGALRRNCGVDKGVFEYPILATYDGLLYEHERGQERKIGGSYATPYVESGPTEIGDGDIVAKVLHIVPDELSLGDVTATFYGRMYPTDADKTYGPYTLNQQPVSTRFTAREARLRLSESVQGRDKAWRVGIPRLGVVSGPRR